MAPNAAKPDLAERHGALVGGDESQESQDLLIKHMLEHGLGVTSIAPVPVDLCYQSKRDAAGSSIEPPKAHNSHLVDGLDGQDGGLKSAKQPRNASNTLVTGTANDSAKQSIRPRLEPFSRRFSNSDANVVLAPTQPILNNAVSAVEGLSQSTRNNPLPTLPPRKITQKITDKMSSDSPTQSNDGRSYEQYSTNDNSQLESSPQASSFHEPEHPTLHEHDTGFLNFRPDFDIPDTVPEDMEVKFSGGIFRGSHAASQIPEESSHHVVPPQTPAVAQRLFGRKGAPLMPASQMFRQTPWTSTVKKVSPTSSRPSPDVFNQNTISPNPIISSPLKNKGLRTSPTHAFTSSPGFPRTSSRPSGDETPSVPTNSHEDERRNQGSVAETPLSRFESPKRKNFPEPIGEYKPLRKQSLETNATKSPTQSDEEQDSDSEVDTAAYRRRLARLKQEKANKSFPSISLPRSSSNRGDNVEVPSTNRTTSALGRKRTDPGQYLAQCYGKTAIDKNGSQETVADSQEASVPPQEHTDKPTASDDSNGGEVNNTEEPRTTGLPEPRAPVSNVEYRETIPETSPPSTDIGPPKLIGDIMKQYSSIRSEMEAVSFPVLSSGTDPEQPKQTTEPRSSSAPEPFSSIPANQKSRPGRGRPLESSPSIVLASSPRSASRRSVRLGNIVTPSSTGHDLPLPSDIGTGTSTLSSLSATPSMTSSITPSTDLGRTSEINRSRSSSPAVANVQRRGRLASSVPGPPSSLPQTRTYSRSRESTRRTTRHSSLSTDELAKSPLPVTGIDEQKPPTRKTARQSIAKRHQLRESAVNHGIFKGMVFALSFKDEQTRKNKDKHANRHSIERMILREGGKILSDGFHELFRFDSFQSTTNASSANTVSSSLTLLNQDAGFTALIADEHSRKTKYMQALALGIPCLAPKWIMNCVSKKEIIDWSSYLLCAGPSALLGEAIRSRNLQPYDASTSKLEDVINNRPKLLDKARILLVMKSNRGEEKRLPYVFLAQILGGSLVRVNSLEEARAKLRDGESQGQPFDWVYVDGDNLLKAQNALFGSVAGNGASKKRKRQSIGTDESDRPPKRIRTLSDQLVIQSLILGRLIEEEEMDE